MISFISAVFGLWLILPESVYGSGFQVPKEIALFIVIALTVSLLKIIPGQIGESLGRQYQIFDNKHTWVMSIIYTMTFGSFIGFAACFPLAIKVIFGYQHVHG